MPSIKTKQLGFTDFFSKTTLAMLCTSFIACGGGGSGTTRVTDDINLNPNPPVETFLTISTQIPVHIRNGILEIFVVGENQPIYSNENFSDFQLSISDLKRSYRDKVIHVKLSGNEKTTMYDPILEEYVSFDGEINAVDVITDKLVLTLTPASEAIYQRSLIRSGNLDITQPDYSLLQRKHITKSTTEINTSLSNAFNAKNPPQLSNFLSISVFNYTKNNPRNYVNTFIGLGLLNLWSEAYPNSKNTYLDLAKNIAVDMRDGYLDGRSIVGDNTPFLPLVNTPKNTTARLNTLFDIGDNQKQARENFGELLKSKTLAYAEKTFQSSRNPEGVTALEQNQYYTDKFQTNTNRSFRWNGAGDYRPAFGIMTTAKCQNISVPPCKQGLNADDIETNYSDIEYLIGTHTVGSCTIKMFPSGDVQFIKNNRVFTGQINRDITDNLLQLDDQSNHYLLNIGAGEMKPPRFMQIELKDAEMISAKIGEADDFYPTQLTKTDMTCS